MIGIGADPGSLGLLESLAGAWREPHRAYHTLQHLQECLDLLDAWVPAGETWARLGVALWFHDVVYDTRHPDSEERSIARARQLLTEAGTPAPAIGHVARLIEATKHSAATPSAADEHLMVDIDLSIFGAPVARWDESCRQVRREFAWVPREVYCERRRAFLEAMLRRPRIFHTQQGAGREGRARQNIRREIVRLSAG